MVQTVLLIDTDEEERTSLARFLQQAGANVVEASSGSQGLFEVLEEGPDIVLLAEQVPPLRGDEVVTVLRRLSDVPIVMLGSGGDPEEGAALERGADAYLRRPWRQAELTARIRSLFRRYRGQSSQHEEQPSREEQTPVYLTDKEKRLLACLAASAGSTTQDALLEAWGEPTCWDTVSLCLRRVRRKLEDAIASPRSLVPRGEAAGMARRMC